MNERHKISLVLFTIIVTVLFSSCSNTNLRESDKKLYSGIMNHNLEQAKEGIEDGENLNKIEGIWRVETNPFLIAIHEESHAIGQYLLENGADVNYTDASGKSLLMRMSDEPNVEFCKLLLKHGAKVDFADEQGNTALEYVLKGDITDINGDSNEEKVNDIITIMLRQGAKINSKTLQAAISGRDNSKDDDMCRYTLVHRILKGLLREGEKSNLNPSVEAAMLGKREELQTLIRYNKFKNEDEKTILLYTAAFGDVETIKLLEDKGINLNCKDSLGNTPFLIASKYGRIDIVKYLFDNNAQQLQKGLLVSIENDQEEVAKFLIESGASLKPIDDGDNRQDALYEAAEAGNVSMIELILSNGYPLDSEHDNLAFAVATQNIQLEAAQYLLDKGADVECEGDTTYLPALIDACLFGNLEVIKFLVKNGVDINGGNIKGDPIGTAAEYGNTSTVAYLINNGADINAVPEYEDCPKDSSALMKAAHSGYLDIVKLLVENGADLEYQNETADNVTVIISAAKRGSLHILEYLIKEGANINYQDKNGETALMAAVNSDYIDNVKLLVKYKADKNLRNNDGCTALDIAKSKNSKAMINILQN